MRKLLPGLVAVVGSLAFSLWALPRLPHQVAVHWGLNGEPNGFASPLIAALLLPLISLGVALLLVAVPGIDPRRESYALHAPSYRLIANVVLVFLALGQVAVIGVNLGWNLRIATLAPIGAGCLLMLVGNVMSRLRPNWFVGIRTPWTLSSERVWRKTHRLGSYTFVAGGALLVGLGLVAPGRAAAGVLVVVVLAGLVPVIYSFLLWRAEKAAGTEP